MEEGSGVVVCTCSSSCLSFWSRVLWAWKFGASLGNRQTDESTEKGKRSRGEAEGATCSRQPLTFVGISSNPVWTLRQLKTFTVSYLHSIFNIQMAKPTFKKVLKQPFCPIRLRLPKGRPCLLQGADGRWVGGEERRGNGDCNIKKWTYKNGDVKKFYNPQ